jgi:hypothetical protein
MRRKIFELGIIGGMSIHGRQDQYVILPSQIEKASQFGDNPLSAVDLRYTPWEHEVPLSVNVETRTFFMTRSRA